MNEHSLHALRVTVTTRPNGRWHTEQFVQAIDASGFDPECQTVENLAAAAWDELVANTWLGIILQAFDDKGTTEDDRIGIYFDGESIADEWAEHVSANYFDLRYINREAAAQ